MGVPAVRETASIVRGLGSVFLALSPWVPTRGPHSLNQVDAAFLTEVLGKKTPGARVESLDVLEGTAGTTNRLRLGIRWNAEGLEADLPKGVFVKGTSVSAKNRTMVASLDMAIHEVCFYRTAREEMGDLAPVAHFASAGVGARFLIVLEDLAHCQHPPFPDEVTIAHAREMMRTLAGLHASFWESPRFSSDLRWAKLFTRRSGFPLLAWSFRRARSTLLASSQMDLPPAVRRMAELVNPNDRALYELWEKGPLTLLHGDCHVGNTYRLPDGRAGLLDWQVAFHGPPIREISYFIAGALSTEQRREHEESLLRLYLETLGERGVVPPQFDEAWDHYRFFFYDVWDSAALTKLWTGLHPPERVELLLRRAGDACVDLQVDRVLEQALRRRSQP